MASRSIYIHNFKQSGLTLIELLIAIGILGLIATLSLFVGVDYYRKSSFRSERSVIVSVLQKARSQSMQNINQVRHGVHFQTAPLQYIIFECPTAHPFCTSFSPSPADEPIAASYNVAFTSTLPADIMFDQLSGDSLATTITINDNGSTSNININSEGRVDW